MSYKLLANKKQTADICLRLALLEESDQGTYIQDGDCWLVGFLLQVTTGGMSVSSTSLVARERTVKRMSL